MRPGDFLEARRRLEAKPPPRQDKLTSISEAIQLVHDGDDIAFGGCMFTRTPLALIMEVLRQGRKNLSLSKNLMCYEGEWFMAVGAVHTIATSWIGIGLPWGISKKLREEAENGRINLEDWSHMAMGLRYHGGAMGVPFLPTFTMLGSDLENVTSMTRMTDPFTGETVGLIPSIFPDVALIHVHRADRFGNCQIDGYPFMDFDIARASTTVIISAEKIISEDEIRSQPERTAIPGLCVDAVVEAPFGAFPHECHGLYEADFSHFDYYTDSIKANGTGAIRDYLDRYVYGTKNHQEYLDLFGREVLERQAQKARELVGEL